MSLSHQSLQIAPVERSLSEQIQRHIDGKTKPVGALGQLEAIAHQLALIQHQPGTKVSELSDKAKMIVFAGDHGIAAEGVSIAPSEVTGQMVQNFLSGGAAINCLCKVNQLSLDVVDCGILTEIDTDSSMLKVLRLGAGTNNFANQAAMSQQQLELGFSYGQQLVEEYDQQGIEILLLGEMGIGNTSAASALMSALTGLSVEQCVGTGTGIDDKQLDKKRLLINNALSRFDSTEPLEVLRQVGGFEIVQMVALILAAAKAKKAVVIDGFIVSAAALVAFRICPDVLDYLIFAHVSEEAGHQHLLAQMQAKPLLQLNLRLGEGTGGALAYGVIKAAVCFYNEMASFESAGVTVE